jgi:thymidine kinase
LQAICKVCNQNASFSFRTTTSQALQQIGGEDMYKPVCRECFNDETLAKEMREAMVNEDNIGLVEKKVEFMTVGESKQKE